MGAIVTQNSLHIIQAAKSVQLETTKLVFPKRRFMELVLQAVQKALENGSLEVGPEGEMLQLILTKLTWGCAGLNKFEQASLL